MLNPESEQKETRILSRPPVLQAYTDFRAYLKDFYQHKVQIHTSRRGGYTYKVFSAAADIKSPNYLKLVIDGERNLSPKTIKKFAKALNLAKQDAQEFELLVLYGQSLDPLERNSHLRRLNEFRMKNRVRSGEVSAASMLSSPNWASWVLYALVDHKDADFSLAGLKKLLRGRIKDAELEKALDHLLKNGSLVQDAQTGIITKGLVIPSAPDDIPTEVIRRLQAELIYLGMESLLNDKANEREFGSLSICLTEAEFEKIKFELRHLRKRIYKDSLMQREKSKGDRVYQLNIQLFPITK